MKERLIRHLIILVAIAVFPSLSGCTNKAPETSNAPAAPPTASAPPTTSVPSGPAQPEKVSKAMEQITAIIKNTKGWRTQGRNYAQLNLQRAVSDGLIPKDMIKSDGGVVNPWGGAVAITPHPELADSFSILFSAVPNADCVQLALQGKNSFEVRVGSWGGIPISEDQAKANCVTGNMWFMPK